MVKTKEAEAPVKVDAGEENVEAEEKSDENKPVVDETPFDPEEFLKLKVKLADDSEVFLFSYGPKCEESGESRPLNCHLCRVASLKDELKKGHIDSKLHQRNLKRKMKPERYNRPYRQFCGINKEGMLVQFEINPGENIPEITDEHKERIFTKEAQYARPKAEDLIILKEEPMHQYGQTMPLLGLDYIFKMMNGDNVIYYCGLCKMKIKGEAFQHIAGATHQAGYIIKHFPNMYAKVTEGLKDIKNDDASEQCIRNIFRQLYKKIEKNKKKKRVNIVEFNYFQQNREEIMKKCYDYPHHGEDTLPFTQKELEQLISKSLQGIEFIKPDLRSLAKPELGYRGVVKPILANKPPTRDEPPAKMRRRDFGNATPEVWAVYQLMLGKIIDEVNADYKTYERNPRSHPHYNYEWKLFWHERCRDLKKDKIDPRYHDFESEWAPYWIQRLRQFYAKDMANRKRELKRLLNLPFDRSPSPIRQMDQQMQPEPMQWQPQPQPQPPQPMFGAPNQMNQDRPVPIFTEDAPIVSSEPLSVISVMRLLTALEDQLGSLGPKAVQLLSRAVLCEKDSGSTDELLLDNDYYVFFATVKEKFRGQLQANVVEPTKFKTVKHCVNEISAILEMMEKALTKERVRQRKVQEAEQKRLLQQQKQQQQQQQQQQKSQMQQQKVQPPSLFDSMDTGANSFGGGAGNNRNDSFGGGNNRNDSYGGGNNRNDSFGGKFSGGNQGGNSSFGGGGGGNNASSGRKRNAAGGGAGSGGNFNKNDGGNIWVTGKDSDNFQRTFSGVNDSSSSGRNFSGGNDNNNSRGGNNSGRNFGGGNNSGGRNLSGDNSSRNFGGNNSGGRGYGGDNSGGRNFGGNNSSRNFGGDNSGGRNFGGDNSGRDFDGDNSGRDFGGDNSGRNFGGDNSGRNFAGDNLGGRSFGGGNNRNDNFNRGFGSGNDNLGRSNFTSDNDKGRSFGGGNNSNFSRNTSGGGGGTSGNFGSGRNLGGSGNNFGSSGTSRGNNSGRNFGGNNASNRGFSSSDNMNSGGGGGLDLYSRRDDSGFADNSSMGGGGGGGSSSFGLNQNRNFGRMMGFNSNF